MAPRISSLTILPDGIIFDALRHLDQEERGQRDALVAEALFRLYRRLEALSTQMSPPPP